MVFTTETLRKLNSPDRFWKRRRIFSQSSHYYGRRKNCYSFAVRAVIRSFKKESYRQTLQASYLKKLYSTRVDAGCQENGTSLSDLNKVLCEAGVGLGLDTLQNLAIWEPRSFKGLTTLTKARICELTKKTEGLYTLEPPPDGVITRGMIGLPISVRSATGDALIVNSKEFGCYSDAYLRNGPDYTFLDGRPTPLKPEEKEKAKDEKEIIERAFKLKKELDFAKDRFKNMKLQEQEDRKRIVASKLKEKGENMLAEKFKKL